MLYQKYSSFVGGSPVIGGCQDSSIPVFKIEYPANNRYKDLINALPLLTEAGKVISAKDIWLSYFAIYPNGHGRSAFKLHFSKWAKDSKVTLRNYSQVSDIPTEDLKF